jgi:Fibronectin type III domain
MGRVARIDSVLPGLRRVVRSRGWTVAILGVLVVAMIVGAGSRARATGVTATFGKTTVGGAADPIASDRKRVNSYALSAAGTVTKLAVYLEPTATSGTEALKGVIYADASGSPGALLTSTNELSFSSTEAAGWYDLPLASGLSLQPGKYWLGLISGASTSVAAFVYDSVSGSRDYNANAYGSGPSNPFGSFSADAEQMSIYASYTPAASPPPPTNTSPPQISGVAQVGQTLSTSNGSWSGSPSGYAYQWSRCDTTGAGCASIAGATGQRYTAGGGDAGSRLSAAVTATNSGGSATAVSAATATVQSAPTTITLGKTAVGGSADSFAPDRKRVSAYALATGGTISKLTIYLAPGGATGQQVLKGVIYADAGGSPGSLLAVSNEFTYASSALPGWYDLTLARPLAVQPARYWIGVITGASTHVAGFRYDQVPNARAVSANVYTAGPSDPFGSFSTDGEQMSLYATVTTSSSLPTQPTGLTATAAGPNEIDLSWKPSTDASGVTGYTIRRNGSVVASTNSTATTFADTGLTPSTTYGYTVDAYDAAGNHSAQSAPASATTAAAGSVQHYEYVFPAGAIDVYDMDNHMRLVKTISLPGATDIRGAVASPSTHILYVSYGGDGGANGNGSMLAYNLLTDTIMWTKNYAQGVDSMAITPDGKTIYMPTGEASSGSNWNIIDAATGNLTGSVNGGSAPHNTIVSLNGKDVFMGGRDASYLTMADTTTNAVVRQIGPLLSGTVRPFTINGKATLAFTTATGFLGFQVSDITTGKVLYTVPIQGNFPYTPGQSGPTSPSHGISLSPDEKQLWVMDQPNDYVHVFDVSGLPTSPPVQIADIKLTQPMTGSQVGCTYDCLREGWLQHSLDGRFVWVGDSGDVISTSTRTVVANLTPLYNSRVFLEIDFSGGLPVATSSRAGLGYVTK